MTAVGTPAQIAQLLRETGTAHHRAFAATNGDDPDWPEWYALHLVEPLGRLLGRTLAAQVLAADLKAVDREQRAAGSALGWPEYYAAWLLERYSGTEGGPDVL